MGKISLIKMKKNIIKFEQIKELDIKFVNFKNDC